jgi:hypothetical protein
MPDYSKSKIYVIKSNNFNKWYVGSTTKKTINDRYSQHKWAFKQIQKGNPSECNYTSNKLLEKGDCYIELIEEYPCNDKYELKKRENYWINQYDTINKVRYIEDENISEEEKKQKYLKQVEKRNANKTFCICQCGGRYELKNTDVKRHQKTRKHLKYLEEHKEDE